MKVTMKNIDSINFNKISLDEYWDDATKEDSKMHRIHAYPAKFPSFMIKKAVNYAKRRKVEVNRIGDIFCGCGTTALEAKRLGLDFWGCDINPVATLIAKVKSHTYKSTVVEKHAKIILDKYGVSKKRVAKRYKENTRINYWYEENSIDDLYKLLFSIKTNVPKGKYQNFFLCAFSNILKPTSKWLTKSIKPQIDPNKKPVSVEIAFQKQIKFMLKAIAEEKNVKLISSINIDNKNFIKTRPKETLLDLIVTSPPYVTSYEYADLHQLSTLWLGYCEDHTALRDGTIGSLFHSDIPEKLEKHLNRVGLKICKDLRKVDSRKTKSVAKYFMDMEQTVKKSADLIKESGFSFFVIGNTKYKGINVDNVKYLALCMLENGYKKVTAYKRKINSKILTPYRSKDGKFSSNKKHRKIYGYEYILVGKK
ncbi:MAG: site-specific DNA-methyltransferase [Candidatus Omnitrophica bacterium]|nr:site-specific DNA-methyltransferase [Candidatus Omnitrophota bacterium]